jgi:hypothetical protein
MLPGLKAADSHNWRVMSHSENVRRSVLVTIMYAAAVATRPFSYSKVCDTFRPLLGQAAARRADLGTESLVDLLVPSSARNRFVAQHVSEGRPACIEHGLRQSGLGESRGVHVSDRDVVEVSHDAMRGFVQEVVPRIPDARVDVGSEAFFVCALRPRQFVGQLGEMLGILDLFAGREGRKVLQSKIDTHFALDRPRLRIGYLDDDVQIPALARVLSEVRAVFDLAVRQRSRVPHAEGMAGETERVPLALEVSAFQRYPAEAAAPAIAQERPLVLSARFGVLLADRVDGARVKAELLARSGRENVQIEAAGPWLVPRQRGLLHVVAIVPDAVDCPRLLLKQAREVFDPVAV